MAFDIKTMVDAYVDAALWTNELLPGDAAEYDGEIDHDSRVKMERDCELFFRRALPDLIDMDSAQAGHDFWLTRNHHGVGFWDRGIGEKGERLTNIAHEFGESDIELGGDGIVYLLQ